MRTFILILSISLTQCVLAKGNFSDSKPVTFKSTALKKVLGLSSFNIVAVDVEQTIADLSTVTNRPLESATVIYKLYGAASQQSDRRILNLFSFNEPLPDQTVLLGSREYLQIAGMSHTNESVRSYAFITLAAAFKGNEELGEWLAEQYFFPSNPIHQDAFYLEVLRIGGFTGKNAKLCIKDALCSQNQQKVLSAIQCIADNPDVYDDLLPDLIVVARKANPLFKDLGYVRGYRDLIRALRRYGKDVTPFKKHIELMRDNCSDNISLHHIASYINSL
jgi:uncharacterized protein YcfL